MSLFRRLFPDPNETVPCGDCGALVMRRTARANGGLCTPCAKLPEAYRAQRRDFAAALQDGRQFRLSPAEQASARPLTSGLPAPDSWIAHPEDIPHQDNKTPQGLLQQAAAGELDALYLRGPGDSRLGLHLRGGWSVVSLTTEDPPGFAVVHGPEAARAQLPEDQQIWLHCPCCYQAGYAAPSKWHMPRAAGLAAMTQILAGQAPAHLRWIDADDPAFVRPGRG